MDKHNMVFVVLLATVVTGCDRGVVYCEPVNQGAEVRCSDVHHLNAQIDFAFPYVGNVGNCNIQTHTNGWTRENIDRWEFEPDLEFVNGQANVVVNGVTNRWTIIGRNRPTYKFGRYDCGFIREDRPNGDHAIYLGLYFEGVLVGAEHLRKGYKWQEHTWSEYDDVPPNIRQVGGGEWESGLLVVNYGVSEDPADQIDVDQMMLRYGQEYRLTAERRRWLKTATLDDIKYLWTSIQKVIDAVGKLPAITNCDYVRHQNVENNHTMQFFELLRQWRLGRAKRDEDKHAISGSLEQLDKLGEQCWEAIRRHRGSHAGPEWGECLREDLMKSWLLDGEDANMWQKVANMRGRIGKYDLEFFAGFARSESFKQEWCDCCKTFILFKVQHDFFESNGYVYAKVVGDEPSYN